MRNKEQVHECIMNIIDFMRKHRQIHESNLSSIECFPTQHKILVFIKENKEKVTQKMISDSFRISGAAVAVSLRKMEKNGLVVRKTSEEDSRFNYVYLTEKSNEMLLKTKELLDETDRKVFEGISDEDFDTMVKCLRIMNKNVSEMEKNERKDDFN